MVNDTSRPVSLAPTGQPGDSKLGSNVTKTSNPSSSVRKSRTEVASPARTSNGDPVTTGAPKPRRQRKAKSATSNSSESVKRGESINPSSLAQGSPLRGEVNGVSGTSTKGSSPRGKRSTNSTKSRRTRTRPESGTTNSPDTEPTESVTRPKLGKKGTARPCLARASSSSLTKKLKVIVRRLPPNLPEYVFWQAVQPFVPFPVPTDPTASRTVTIGKQGEEWHSVPETKDGTPPESTDAERLLSHPKTEPDTAADTAPQDTTSLDEVTVTRTVCIPPTFASAEVGGYYRWFLPGKVSTNPNKPPVSARAYLRLKTTEELLQFHRKFNGHVFVDSRGCHYQALVEFAPGAWYPRPTHREDTQVGTIQDDPHFQNFVEALRNPSNSDQSKESTPSTEPLPTTTHLLEFLQAKKQQESGRKLTIDKVGTGKQPGVLVLQKPLEKGPKRGERRPKKSITTSTESTAKPSRGERSKKSSKRTDVASTEGGSRSLKNEGTATANPRVKGNPKRNQDTLATADRKPKSSVPRDRARKSKVNEVQETSKKKRGKPREKSKVAETEPK
ncbi:hypothetical protein IWQ61_009703 [Dispira simplex]|nr:hypothetical protein IWQ61_009703 [Dispira simplex]